MLGTTVTRDGVREENKEYTYSQNRTAYGFDQRLGSEQSIYDRYAAAEVVNQRPMPRQAQPQARMYQPQTQSPERGDELWQRLNTNNVSRNTVASNSRAYSPTRSNVQAFEPMRLHETSYRPATKRKTSKQMSTQGKVIMAVYLAVVLLIVTLVIINAELINTPSAEANPGVASVNNLYEVNDSGLNFVETKYNTFEEETNWFDQALDKIGE